MALVVADMTVAGLETVLVRTHSLEIEEIWTCLDI
jgi:hypothetical protein